MRNESCRDQNARHVASRRNGGEQARVGLSTEPSAVRKEFCTASELQESSGALLQFHHALLPLLATSKVNPPSA